MQAQLNEMIGLTVTHRSRCDALKRLRTITNETKELCWVCEYRSSFSIPRQKIQTVNCFPHFASDLFANTASIFTRVDHTANDTIRVKRLPEHKLNHRLGIGLSLNFNEKRLIARGFDQRLPTSLRVTGPDIK